MRPAVEKEILTGKQMALLILALYILSLFTS